MDIVHGSFAAAGSMLARERWSKTTAEQRREVAKNLAAARWGKRKADEGEPARRPNGAKEGE
jgi:hypothetical protein